jgi:hypothetical protein
MQTLTDREKRTVRTGAVLIVVYLVLFFGLRSGKHLTARRSEYRQMLQDAQRLNLEVQHYNHESLAVGKLTRQFHLDLARLSRPSLVADAGAAIQKAATSGGIQLGPVRESPPRAAVHELASMQLEATGPVPAALKLLERLRHLGYPVVLDAVQIRVDPARPGTVKLTLTLVILDFAQWHNPEETPHA